MQPFHVRLAIVALARRLRWPGLGYTRFVENALFKRFVGDLVFNLTSEATAPPASSRQ
jgi:hypothetical protein